MLVRVAVVNGMFDEDICQGLCETLLVCICKFQI